MSKFKPGDRVICVDAGGSNGDLEEGKVYIVDRLSRFSDSVAVVGVNNRHYEYWGSMRFELYEPFDVDGACAPRALGDLGRSAHETAVSKGFYEAKPTPEAVAAKLALIHSEVSEALEAVRNEEGDDRVAEELADTVIRICDLAEWLGLDLDAAVAEKMEANEARERMHGGKTI